MRKKVSNNRKAEPLLFCYLKECMNRSKWIVTLTWVILVLVSCGSKQNSQEQGETEPEARGYLFIMGGGDRPRPMVRSLIELSGVDSTGYLAVLPMSSSVPDTSAWYAEKQFRELGLNRLHTFNIQQREQMTPSVLDSIRRATLIYISGGSQNRFMNIVRDTPLEDAIQQAYRQGSTIAGTSAGAAVMSEMMITGDERKHPEYTGNFRTIEANNIIIEKGLGLIPQAIVDQHFVRRMRMNRLVSACLEHPGKVGIGIDEATALWVDGNQARVYGRGQVVVLRNANREVTIREGLLGGKLSMNIYLPGQHFHVE